MIWYYCINFNDVLEMQGALKGYLESGDYRVGDIRGVGDAGLIPLGNIDSYLMNENKNMFSNLPKIFQESALLDRFHGFIKGWTIPKVNENLKANSWALNTEYFGEIVHSLRDELCYRAVVDQILEVPKNAATRDTEAIKRIFTGFLKLLFPHVESIEQINTTDFEKYCLGPVEQFILSSVVDEVRATSDIEGIHSTRMEIKEVVSGSVQSARFSSIVAKYKSILTNSAPMSFKTCEDIRVFYDEFAHKEVTANDPTHKLDGNLFRQDSVDITSTSGKILHRGVQPEERIIELLNVTLEILHNPDMPLLARVAIFHYLFEYIHPFYDGNGRTARFIVSYFLASRFHQLVALRLSVLIRKNRKKYYELFRETDSEWNCGDLTPFVLGFTEIVSATFDDISILLNNKIMQLTKYRQRLSTLIEGDTLTDAKACYATLCPISSLEG